MRFEFSTLQYNHKKPHAVTQAGDMSFEYDLNGNMTKRTNLNTNKSMSLVWDDENRLKRTVDALHTTDYKYDANGERIVKRSSLGETVYVSASCMWLSVDPALEEYLPTGKPKDNAKLPGKGGAFKTLNLNLYHYAGNNPVVLSDPDGKHAYLSGIPGQSGLIKGTGEKFNYKGYAVTYNKNNDGTFSFGKINLWKKNEEKDSAGIHKIYDSDKDTDFKKGTSILAVSERTDDDGKAGHFATEIVIDRIMEDVRDDSSQTGNDRSPIGYNAARTIYGTEYELDKGGNRIGEGKKFVKKIAREGDGARETNQINVISGTAKDDSNPKNHGSLMDALIRYFSPEGK
jgi:YD repeat-containing protein